MKRTETSERGFSLIELVVALGVAAVVSMGALALLGSQQRVFHSSSGSRGLQEGARAALSEVGTSLRRAGYGIEPSLAFDFGTYPSGDPSGTTTTCEGTGAVQCRDATDRSDEIVFYARSPSFSRTLASAPSTSTIVVTAPLTAKLPKGQILQVMCDGASRWAYVTVSSTSADGLTITLDTSKSDVFPYQQGRLESERCMTTGWASVRVFKVERFHYFVASYDGRPYLMLDRGLLDGANKPILEPVAPDVEDVQFAYVFPRTTPQVAGGTAGTRLSKAADGIDLDAVPPAFDAEMTDPARDTRHPANIRAVRVSLVVRTSSADPTITSADERTIPAAGNRGSLTGPQGHRRIIVETTEAVRNLDSRGAFVPPYSQTSGDGLNVGGG